MSNILYIVCGDMQEFRSRIWHPVKTVRYAQNSTLLRGCRNIDFVITDSGWRRKDIGEMIHDLIICNIHTPMESKTRYLRMEQLLYA